MITEQKTVRYDCADSFYITVDNLVGLANIDSVLDVDSVELHRHMVNLGRISKIYADDIELCYPAEIHQMEEFQKLYAELVTRFEEMTRNISMFWFGAIVAQSSRGFAIDYATSLVGVVAANCAPSDYIERYEAARAGIRDAGYRIEEIILEMRDIVKNYIENLGKEVSEEGETDE